MRSLGEFENTGPSVTYVVANSSYSTIGSMPVGCGGVLRVSVFWFCMVVTHRLMEV